jgi:hypothetical protein
MILRMSPEAPVIRHQVTIAEANANAGTGQGRYFFRRTQGGVR